MTPTCTGTTATGEPCQKKATAGTDFCAQHTPGREIKRKPSRTSFGAVRKRASGRWQATYWAAGQQHHAPHTFVSKTRAQEWLAGQQTALGRGRRVNPSDGKILLKAYAEVWMARRPDLRDSTRAKYRYLLDSHILPSLGETALARLEPSAVRAWWAKLHKEHPSTAAGAYRLLATICNTAVGDEMIGSSPCRVKGASEEAAAERPTASIAEVTAAVAAVPENYRLAPLLAAWVQLRRSEVLGLQRRDVDLLHANIHVRRGVVNHMDGRVAIDRPKTETSIRVVSVPSNIVPVLEDHLDRFVKPEPSAWLFAGEGGRPINPRTVDRAWEAGRDAIGRPDLRFHDLRHSGLSWSAATGATTAELMFRAGHKSSGAAIRYQHASRDRDRALADALAGLAGASVTPIAPDESASTTNARKTPTG
jgi:integrase